jgi:hypothetical protein
MIEHFLILMQLSPYLLGLLFTNFSKRTRLLTTYNTLMIFFSLSMTSEQQSYRHDVLLHVMTDVK